ncbi:MAG: hypothetical protein AAF907_09725, partial [Planctomycetota bacterium]
SEHTNVGINGFQAPFPIRAAIGPRYKLIRNLAPQNRFDIGGMRNSASFQSWRALAVQDDDRAKNRVRRIEDRPAEEFYDLQTDPFELTNLALFAAPDPSLDEERLKLARSLGAWMEQQGDRGMPTELAARSRQNRGRKKAAGKKTR